MPKNSTLQAKSTADGRARARTWRKTPAIRTGEQSQLFLELQRIEAERRRTTEYRTINLARFKDRAKRTMKEIRSLATTPPVKCAPLRFEHVDYASRALPEEEKNYAIESATVLRFREKDYRYWLSLFAAGSFLDWQLIGLLVRRAMGQGTDSPLLCAERTAHEDDETWQIESSGKYYFVAVIVALRVNEIEFTREIVQRWGLLEEGRFFRELVLDSMLGDCRDWSRYRWPIPYGERYLGRQIPEGRGEL